LAHAHLRQLLQASPVLRHLPQDAKAVHDIVGDELFMAAAERSVLVVIVSGTVAHVGRQLGRQLRRVIPRDEVQDMV
jgi:hypothetical protein